MTRARPLTGDRAAQARDGAVGHGGMKWIN